MKLFDTKNHVPTRTCPHRWCKPLHLIPFPFAIALFAFQLWNDWTTLITVILGYIGFYVATKLIHFKPTHRSRPPTVTEVVDDLRSSPGPLDLEMQDAKYAGTGWRMLEVRKGWARVAVGFDFAFVILVGFVCTTVFTNPEAEAARLSQAEIGPSLYIGVAMGVAAMSFGVYAHKKATQPRKPKKAWLPAFLRTNV